MVNLNPNSNGNRESSRWSKSCEATYKFAALSVLMAKRQGSQLEVSQQLPQQQQQHDDDDHDDDVGTPPCLATTTAGVVWQKQFNIAMNLEPSTSTVEKLSINNKAQAIIRLLLLLLL